MNILFNPLKFIPFLLIDKQLIYLLSLGEFFLCNNNLIIHKMDIINHALSGLVVANLTCETVEQKALVVMGSILPDIFFSPFYLYLSKKTGKTFIIMHITSRVYVNQGTNPGDNQGHDS